MIVRQMSSGQARCLELAAQIQVSAGTGKPGSALVAKITRGLVRISWFRAGLADYWRVAVANRVRQGQLQ